MENKEERRTSLQQARQEVLLMVEGKKPFSYSGLSSLRRLGL